MIPQPPDPECHDPDCAHPTHCEVCGEHHVVARMHEERNHEC